MSRASRTEALQNAVHCQTGALPPGPDLSSVGRTRYTELCLSAVPPGKSLCCFLVTTQAAPRCPPPSPLGSCALLPLITGVPLPWCSSSPSHLYLLKRLFLSFKTATSSRKPSRFPPGRSYLWHVNAPIALGLNLYPSKLEAGSIWGHLWSAGRQKHRSRRKFTCTNKGKACTQSVPCVSRGWVQQVQK